MTYRDANCDTHVLLEIVRRFGTPTYAFDVRRLRRQVDVLKHHLPDVDVLYSLKANASLGICDVFADAGIGADVASAGELATAVKAGFAPDRIFVAGPFKMPETIERLHDLPDAIVSIDSLSEWEMLAAAAIPNRCVLRLRPDFGSCAVVAAGCESRFGFTEADLTLVRDALARTGMPVVGFHVFAGSQVLVADEVNEHLRRSLELCLRAAETTGITPEILNLGGGFGIPYGSDQNPLDMTSVAAELARMAQRAGGARMILELGRFLVAEAGWYLTSVVGAQTHQGRPAVIVDGGTHQRADMCGLCLRSSAYPPVALRRAEGWRPSQNEERQTADVLGCLSLPADVMSEATTLPHLVPGDVLAYGNAGAYGVWSSPAIFHASPLPAEVAFDGDELILMRERRAADSVLDHQRHINSPPVVIES